MMTLTEEHTCWHHARQYDVDHPITITIVRSPIPTLVYPSLPSRPKTPERPTPLLRLFSSPEMPFVPNKIYSSSKACLSGPFSRKPVLFSPAGPSYLSYPQASAPLLSAAGLVLWLGCHSHCCLAALTHPYSFQVQVLLLPDLAGVQGPDFLLAPFGQGSLGW